MASPKVGGEVDAFCTKCRMTLAHTVLAMVGAKVARVRCNTCNGDHAFRSAPGTTDRVTTPRATAKPRAQKVVISFDEQLEGKNTAAAQPYSVKETYALNQVFTHPTFGVGFVTAVRGDKVDITFRSETKTLVHGRGGPAVERPAFQAMNAKSLSPADKKPTQDSSIASVSAPGGSES